MNLASSLMGLSLPHPFVAGASPLGRDLDTVRRLEDGGAAAIVLPSLFEEQITMAADGRIRHAIRSTSSGRPSLQHFPGPSDYAYTPEEYAEHVARVKRAVSIPVVGSLNGTTAESWLTFSRLIEQAGASAIELNMYEVVTDFRVSSAAIEHQLVHVVAELKQYLKIPIAVKLSPFFASVANLARQLDHAGADALVLFNRFYQPDIDIDDHEPPRPRAAVHERRAAAAAPVARDSPRAGAAVARRDRRRGDARGRDQGRPRRRRRGAGRVRRPATTARRTSRRSAAASRNGWSATRSRTSTTCAGRPA